MDSSVELFRTATECYAMAERSSALQDQKRWNRIGDRWTERAIAAQANTEPVIAIDAPLIAQLTAELRRLGRTRESGHQVAGCSSEK